MISETRIRVRYSETDQMGVVYYANYFIWMEIGRTDLIRKWGITYKEIEERGFLLPVIYASAKFLGSAYYDDEIIIQSALVELTKTRVSIGYKIFRADKEVKLICVGISDLVFLDKSSRKVVKAPSFFVELMKVEDTEEYREFVEFVRTSLAQK
ncbi:MAG: thioesterase family protein [Brevinematia bacterium]